MNRLAVETVFERAAARLADNKRYASRNSKIPSLLQGLTACSTCGYGYYHTSTRTTNKKIFYYRCLGSDDYRYEHGRVCTNQPVRADYLDTIVWDHITSLLSNPALVRTEINRRLEQARTTNPVTRQRDRLQQALLKATTAISRMIEAYSEHLITIDELRTRMPDLRAREATLRAQLDTLDAQIADRDAYLRLADDLEGFLGRLQHRAATSDITERQHVLRLVVKDILIGPDKITIRHRIPIPKNGTKPLPPSDTEGDQPVGCLLRWGRVDAVDERAPETRPSLGEVIDRFHNPVCRVLIGFAQAHEPFLDRFQEHNLPNTHKYNPQLMSVASPWKYPDHYPGVLT